MTAMAAGWLVLMVLGVPVAFALGAAVLVYMLLAGNTAMLFNIPGRIVGGLYSFPLLAVPFFILAGNLMNKSGVTQRLVAFADTLVGFLPGGLGQVAVVSNIVMSGMSGSGLADASATGSVLIPAMRSKGFSPPFAAAIIGAAATMGPLIPPSIPAVVYGVLAEASIGALFIGGVIPGLIVGGSLMLLVAYLSRTRDIPRRARPTLGELGHATVAAIPALLLPVIILGGILGGVFTPTEAAVVASAYAVLLGFVTRSLGLSDLADVFRETALTSSVILLIVGAASLFAWVLTLNQVPQQLLALLLGFTTDANMTMLLLVLFMLFMGFFLDMMAVLIVSMPLINPIIAAVGIDPVHFGVVFALGIMIGTITPPFGLILFLLSQMTGESIGRLARELAPFYVVLVAVLFLIAFVPPVVLFLPNLLFQR
ncbi:MAG: TRAP transporter large permease [Chloroflexi bacterium]|nr:TRAP transporter large permease [Chloroflexota bacterium]